MNARHEVGAASVGALVFLVAANRLDAAWPELGRLVILGCALGAIAAIDVAEHRVPNRIVLPASAACAALLAAGGVQPQRLLAGAGVVAVMLAFSLAWPASLGMGDVKLAMLVVFGLAGLAAQALLLGLVFAAGFGVLLLVREGHSATRQSLPLAPFASAGAILAVVL